MRWLDRLRNPSPHVPSRLRTFCPYCGIAMVIDDPSVERSEITWDAENSRFVVSVLFNCCGSCARSRYAGRHFRAEVVKNIPLTIAQSSRCVCGDALVLKNHALRTKGEYVEFEGEYACDACRKARTTIVRKIGRGLRSMWSRTKRIEVGIKGLSYERETTPE
jgi:hypothetical protein